jgi:predicted CxxxxCH...CXXCH cytochrome family protein
MNLPDFIRSHRGQIIEEWEAFARTRLPAAARMSKELLRDHVGQLVDAVAADMEVPQSPHEVVSNLVSNAIQHGSKDGFRRASVGSRIEPRRCARSTICVVSPVYPELYSSCRAVRCHSSGVSVRSRTTSRARSSAKRRNASSRSSFSSASSGSSRPGS